MVVVRTKSRKDVNAMEVLDYNLLETLKRYKGDSPCISIYLPTLRKGEVSQNQIRFKNLLTEAENQLLKKNYKKNKVEEILEPAYKLVDETIFWNNQSEGLALFISPEFYRYYRLPCSFDELVVTADKFHTKPLLPLISEDGQFYVLVISQKDARLLRGTRDVFEEMDLSEVIKKFEEKFGQELPEQYLQFHTRTARRGGEVRTAVHFGHGGEIDSIKKERLLHYFRFLDKELYSMLYNDGSPLILACVDYLSSLYRQANNYPGLMEERIKGNPDNIKSQELHKEAWEIISPYFKRKTEESKARYLELKGTGKTSNEIKEVVRASSRGRIKTLFVPLGVRKWGKFDQENEYIEIKETPEPGDEDLLDVAAAEVYLNRGEVLALTPENMPDGDEVAAIFRY